MLPKDIALQGDYLSLHQQREEKKKGNKEIKVKRNMSGCGGNCGCGYNCKCGGGCKKFPDLTVSEAKGAEILISGLAPLVGDFTGALEMADRGYDVSEGCKCGKYGCDLCTCK